MKAARLPKPRGPKSRPGMLVLTVAVGSVPPGHAVPPGYELADCFRCNQPVWIHPEMKRIARRRDLELKAMCQRCHGLFGGRN